MTTPQETKPTRGRVILVLGVLLLVAALIVGIMALGPPYYAISQIALFTYFLVLIAIRLKECFRLASGTAYTSKLISITSFLVLGLIPVFNHLGDVVQSETIDYIQLAMNICLIVSLLFTLDLAAALFKKGGMPLGQTMSPHTLSEEVKALADKTDGKIAAMALHREQTGANLVLAKETVEAYLAGPALKH